MISKTIRFMSLKLNAHSQLKWALPCKIELTDSQVYSLHSKQHHPSRTKSFTQQVLTRISQTTNCTVTHPKPRTATHAREHHSPRRNRWLKTCTIARRFVFWTAGLFARGSNIRTPEYSSASYWLSTSVLHSNRTCCTTQCVSFCRMATCKVLPVLQSRLINI